MYEKPRNPVFHTTFPNCFGEGSPARVSSKSTKLVQLVSFQNRILARMLYWVICHPELW